MFNAEGPYRLRCQLRAHDDDVRGICICGESGIATSSRDKTVRFWTPDPDNKNSYVLSKTLVGHSSFVGPLAWIPPCETLPEGGLASGGMDTLIQLWDLAKSEPVQTMKGHKAQVTGLVVDENGDIFSSSVDCSIKRWRKGHLVESWEAHKVAVQDVLKLPTGELVTGSSDTTLKIWNGNVCLHTFTGHSDTVRGLCFMPGLGILSASHDGSVRLWALTGQVLLEMVGHTSLVYSVDSHPSGLVASSGEDCFVKIWRDGVCIQSIEHPGCVWDAKFLENGDVVTACSDGYVRLWSAQIERASHPTDVEAYESMLTNYRISRKKIGGLNLSELPGLEGLQVPGTNDGQTKVIREGDNAVAYSWNLIEKKWEKIGEVVDAPGDNTNRAALNGVQYDYVFDVDIGDGEPIRKLPYNRTDNPYATADNWLLNENLPLSYREQIVQFILQNTGQQDFSLDTSFRDPYTGSSAYIPGEPSRPVVDTKKPAFKHIPKKGYLFFDTAQFDGILKKIAEFNGVLSTDSKHNHLAMKEIELSRLNAIINILKDLSHYHVSTFADVDVNLLLKLLKSWSLSMLFPAIDVIRMLVLHPEGANLLHKHIEQDDVLTELFKKVTRPPVIAANLLTSARVIVNLFRHSYFHNWLHLHSSEILDGFSSCRSSFNKTAHLAYSTMLLNYAVLLIEKKDYDGQAQVLSAALEVAEDESQDNDSKFRALVAVGSLMLEGLVKQVAIDFDVQTLALVAKGSTEAKVAEVGADIELLVKSA